MPFDFPNSPTLGQNATAPNGAVFVWDGAKWTTAANAATIGAGGPFLPLSGGTMAGGLNYTATGSTTSRAAQDRSAESSTSKTSARKATARRMIQQRSTLRLLISAQLPDPQTIGLPNWYFRLDATLSPAL